MSSRGKVSGLLLSIVITLAGAPIHATVLDANDVETWSDATFEPALATHRFSGLVIAVVQGDSLLFAKGYGFADYEAQTRVDPAVTRFRIGSISKTFTATAIAQLIDAGAIKSVDEPAASYLRRVRLTGTQEKITLDHLLTHRGGFDASAFGLGTNRDAALPLSAGQVGRYSNALVRTPGELSVYSNYGIALLGLIVEDVTGQKAHDYLRDKIFEPLSMHDTTLNNSSRPSRNLGVPYAFLPNGQAQKVNFVGVHPLFAPAGALESTALDMAKYMLSNIDEGRGTSASVVSADGYQRLHRRVAGNHPASSGFGMSFLTLDWNGTHFVGHGGDWPGFHSIMLFSPQDKVGFFVSCMCEYPQGGLLEQLGGYGRFRADLSHPVELPLTNVGIAQAFLKRFWGARTPVRQAANTDLSVFEGTYWHEDRNHFTVEKLLELTGGPASTLVVEREDAKHLRINGTGGYEAIAPGVFWNPSAEPNLSQNFWDSELWAFSADPRGTPHAASPTWGLDPYVRTSPYASPRFVANAAAVLTLVALSGIVALFWPARCRASRLGTFLPTVTAGAVVGIPLVLFSGYREGDGFVFALLLGEPGRFLWAIILANAVALLAVGLSGTAILAWRNAYWGDRWRGIARRIHFSLLATAALGLAMIAAFFNLLGVHLP
jgi:CubicO group peptidase (beta-lactamase class C family)